MFDFIDNIPYTILLFVAIFLLLAPFQPMPHVVEKILMLKDGNLKKPMDIFDLFFHLIPTLLLLVKAWRSFNR